MYPDIHVKKLRKESMAKTQ